MNISCFKIRSRPWKILPVCQARGLKLDPQWRPRVWGEVLEAESGRNYYILMLQQIAGVDQHPKKECSSPQFIISIP